MTTDKRIIDSMNNRKEKSWIGKNLVLIMVILATVLIVILLNGQSLFNGQSSNPISDQNVSIGNNTNMSNETNADKDFKNWLSLSFMPIYNDLDCISKAGKNQNFSDTELCGKLLKEDSNRSLRQISKYNVSISLQASLDEYKKSLEYYNIGGLNLEIGARNRNVTQMVEATRYIQNGTENMYIVTNILNNISYKNDTQNIEKPI